MSVWYSEVFLFADWQRLLPHTGGGKKRENMHAEGRRLFVQVARKQSYLWVKGFTPWLNNHVTQQDATKGTLGGLGWDKRLWHAALPMWFSHVGRCKSKSLMGFSSSEASIIHLWPLRMLAWSQISDVSVHTYVTLWLKRKRNAPLHLLLSVLA